MKTKMSLRNAIIILLMIMESMYMVSCESSAVLSPNSSEDANTTSSTLLKRGKGSGGEQPPAIESDLLLVRRREENEEGVSTAIIGPAGGVLIHADHRIEIPPGALTDSLELTFSMPVSDTLWFELGPHGTQFLLPVRLVFNYNHAWKSGLEELDFDVVVFNPQATEWDSLFSSVDVILDEITCETEHFSRYAISK